MITEWTARLDEQERVAKDADRGRWLVEGKQVDFEFHGDEWSGWLAADTKANARHIGLRVGKYLRSGKFRRHIGRTKTGHPDTGRRSFLEGRSA